MKKISFEALASMYGVEAPKQPQGGANMLCDNVHSKNIKDWRECVTLTPEDEAEIERQHHRSHMAWLGRVNKERNPEGLWMIPAEGWDEYCGPSRERTGRVHTRPVRLKIRCCWKGSKFEGISLLGMAEEDDFAERGVPRHDAERREKSAGFIGEGQCDGSAIAHKLLGNIFRAYKTVHHWYCGTVFSPRSSGADDQGFVPELYDRPEQLEWYDLHKDALDGIEGKVITLTMEWWVEAYDNGRYTHKVYRIVGL